MPEANSVDQLRAIVKAVEDAALVDQNDAAADVQRAKNDLTNIQSLHESVKAHFNDQQAAPYARMVEDAQVKVNAKIAALAASEQRMASVREANAELLKLVAADEGARGAGYKGGISQAAGR